MWMFELAQLQFQFIHAYFKYNSRHPSAKSSAGRSICFLHSSSRSPSRSWSEEWKSRCCNCWWWDWYNNDCVDVEKNGAAIFVLLELACQIEPPDANFELHSISSRRRWGRGHFLAAAAATVAGRARALVEDIMAGRLGVWRWVTQDHAWR